MKTVDLRFGDGYGPYMERLKASRRAIARHEGCRADQITVTCGATGAIDLLFGALPKGSMIAAMPYEYYDIHVIAALHGHRTIRPPQSAANSLDDFLRFVGECKPQALYLSLPNNPLGTIYPSRDLKRLFASLDADQLCIIDQTLIAEKRLGVRWLGQAGAGKTVAVVRSFSKTHGAVVDRVGYVVMPCFPLDLHLFTHTPGISSLRKIQHLLEDKKTPARLLERIQSNDRAIAAWAVGKKDLDWRSSRTNFGVLHTGERENLEMALLGHDGVIINGAPHLSCPGNFIRIPLDVSPASIRRLLAVIDDAL
ncbi:aminotransferase class I/II-fold pyridoxal phosphate-dependent enzyme [Patescibacteria group bacterium]|nr:MAG: aminotransferase class I/II-fold pyridoxal phosphate-dependent enzyme [Patescibacteria group bacterium]